MGDDNASARGEPRAPGAHATDQLVTEDRACRNGVVTELEEIGAAETTDLEVELEITRFDRGQLDFLVRGSSVSFGHYRSGGSLALESQGSGCSLI